jgi:predicted metal-dependent RNase
MTRRAPRITYDEIRAVLKGVMNAGLKIRSVNFDGEELTVHIKNDAEAAQESIAGPGKLIREPKL